ncbi:hypothetical protein CALCODRAFT_49189 [Calocera cornea HHB12733]|uniref:Uncharacterized protein n=1 Tax=Calocera cornea HHB12733 TaxID=1353952 RepID=A0A165DTB7_9BASI|nr:hypothetical protein CALCODRAFT_49189 [Calocera cornea HHB12733]
MRSLRSGPVGAAWPAWPARTGRAEKAASLPQSHGREGKWPTTRHHVSLLSRHAQPDHDYYSRVHQQQQRIIQARRYEGGREVQWSCANSIRFDAPAPARAGQQPSRAVSLTPVASPCLCSFISPLPSRPPSPLPSNFAFHFLFLSLPSDTPEHPSRLPLPLPSSLPHPPPTHSHPLNRSTPDPLGRPTPPIPPHSDQHQGTQRALCTTGTPTEGPRAHEPTSLRAPRESPHPKRSQNRSTAGPSPWPTASQTRHSPDSTALRTYLARPGTPPAPSPLNSLRPLSSSAHSERLDSTRHNGSC